MARAKRVTKKQLEEAVHEHLKRLGFSKNGKGYVLKGELTKARIRKLYEGARERRILDERRFVEQHGHLLAGALADGREVDPSSVHAELVQVLSGTPEAALFRLATLLWSIPVSRGFGRRLRFLVRDRQNSRLIGVFALGDPVFNLTARDTWIGWDAHARKERLVHVMDAYVVGALPPYSQLLGGKLVAALLASEEVRTAYEARYLDRKSIISGVKKNAALAMITTTSALGRSSMYNRLRVPGGPEFVGLGFTKGFGHFHLDGHVFDMMRDYLEQENHPYASGNRFGMGPSWRLRVVRAALEELGLESATVLKHGIRREVFALPVAANWKEVLLGKASEVQPLSWSSESISRSCIDRWIVPRSRRRPDYVQFRARDILADMGISTAQRGLSQEPAPLDASRTSNV